MKIVIDIPEALYDRVKQLDYSINMYDFADSMYRADIKNLASAIKDGSPLPKECSKDALSDTAAYRYYKYLVPSEGVAPIIEDPVTYVRGRNGK